MTNHPRRVPPTIGIAGPVFLASLAVSRLRVPQVLRLVAPAIVAYGAAMLLQKRSANASGSPAIDAGRQTRQDAAEARLHDMTRAATQLRHDLRGILSPAMLMADRLAMSDDPVSRRAGEAMISTIERAEARLKPSPTPPADAGPSRVL